MKNKFTNGDAIAVLEITKYRLAIEEIKSIITAAKIYDKFYNFNKLNKELNRIENICKLALNENKI
jgi:hypothetical protein